MPIDYSAGIIVNYRIGDYYDTSKPFAVLFSDDEDKMKDGEEIFVEAVEISDKKTKPVKPVIEIISNI